MTARMSVTLTERALALLAVGKVELADREIRDAIALDPENPLANFAHAQILGAQERYEEAIAALDRANMVEAGWWHACRATYYSKSERHKEALIAADEAVNLDPENPVCWYRKGAALVRAGQKSGERKLVTQGKAALVRANELDPSFYMSRIDLATLYLAEGNRAAEVLIKELLQLKFGDPRVHQVAAEAALLWGKLDEAQSHADLVISAWPNSPGAIGMILNVKRAQKSRIYRALWRGVWFSLQSRRFGVVFGGALGVAALLLGLTKVHLFFALCIGAAVLLAWHMLSERQLAGALKRPELNPEF